jgi:hypothetical protein
VVQRREEVGNPIDVKLKQVADELHNVVVSYLQVGVTYICCSDNFLLLIKRNIFLNFINVGSTDIQQSTNVGSVYQLCINSAH